MRRNAFTLPELLVVIGIIVVLIAMLLPSLNRAWAAAKFVNCQSNLQQLGLAAHLYVVDNRGYLPFANWDPQGAQTPIAYGNATTGWLFACQNPQSTFTADTVQTGSLWPYLLHEGVYHCPTHIPGDAGTYGGPQNYTGGPTDVMTSYMMNGAISAYGRYMSGSAPTGLAYYFKIAQFDSQDALMWETAESDPSGWNDGGTYPYESYNPAGPGRTAPEGAVTRHAFYFSLLSMDGHVEAMATSEYWTMAAPTVSTRNRLYCCPSIPQVTNGGAPG